MGRRKRYFEEMDKAALLTSIRSCREASIRASTVAPIGGEIYRACDTLRAAIDDLAEIMTGKRDYLLPPFHSTQFGPLSPVGPMRLATGQLRTIEDYPEPDHHPQFAMVV